MQHREIASVGRHGDPGDYRGAVLGESRARVGEVMLGHDGAITEAHHCYGGHVLVTRLQDGAFMPRIAHDQIEVRIPHAGERGRQLHLLGSAADAGHHRDERPVRAVEQAA